MTHDLILVVTGAIDLNIIYWSAKWILVRIAEALTHDLGIRCECCETDLRTYNVELIDGKILVCGDCYEDFEMYEKDAA